MFLVKANGGSMEALKNSLLKLCSGLHTIHRLYLPVPKHFFILIH